jgi:hypothetical protein
MSQIAFIFVLSIWRIGKCSSKSLKVKMPNSLRSISARKGPTPLRYSIDESSMEDELLVISCFFILNYLQISAADEYDY